MTDRDGAALFCPKCNEKVFVRRGAGPVGAECWNCNAKVQRPDSLRLHRALESILAFFEYAHLPPALREVSAPFHKLAHELALKLEGPELTAGLRKLLESKDAAVRAGLDLVEKRKACEHEREVMFYRENQDASVRWCPDCGSVCWRVGAIPGHKDERDMGWTKWTLPGTFTRNRDGDS